MLLSNKEIKEQTIQLWKECFDDPDDFVEVYFDEKYRDELNFTVRPDGYVAGAVQVFPYRMTLYDEVMHAGYVSGLTVAKDYRRKGVAAQLISEAHRHLYNKGAMLSFVIPANNELRKFYEGEKHGAYWTSVYRHEEDLVVDGPLDHTVVVTQPDEWGNDLYVFYHNWSMRMPFMLHPAENDFFAALANCDIDGGWVLVARRKGRVSGICLAVPDDGDSCMVRSILVTDNQVKDCLVNELLRRSGKKRILAKFPCGGNEKGAEPYAMARVVDVEKFLQQIAMLFPDLQMRVGVGQDLDIPENNGFYIIDNGKVSVTDEEPDSIVTPGGLAAMFLSMYPIRMEMMLDE